MPDIVPTKPCARLNRPVPCEVGDDQCREHAQHRPTDAVEYLSGDENDWIGGPGEHQRTDRQRCESDEQQRPAAPRVRPASGPGRHDRHDHLGDHDQRRDDERGKGFLAVRERLTGEWQHRRVGQLEQEHAAGEYEQAAVFRKAP